MSEDTTDATVKLGRTPMGQQVLETPRVSAPAARHDLFGLYSFYIGDPIARYGRRTLPTHVPMTVKLQMLKHPVIAMCCGFTGATLVKARREIRCRDERKRKFFEALFRKWEMEFILQANVGIALGSIGLIKRWAFETPQALNTEDPPVWTGRATPFIIKGFDPCYPTTSEPEFDEKGRVFQGIRTADGKVDVFYSLWLTFRQAWAFGAYTGAGRLDHAYNDWWMSEFGRDTYLVTIQKNADKITKVGYPPGKAPDGRDNQAVALEIGDNVRSGATVAMPTQTYETKDVISGATNVTNVARWTLEFLDAAADFGKFHEIDDHHAQRMALGIFVPPQAFLNVKQSALGGPTTADVLTELAEELLMQDAADIDRHVNKYVFPAISRANFPADSPRVEVVTTGLESDNREQLFEIIKGLIGQHPDITYFDFRQAMERLEFPLRSEEEVEQERAENEKKQEAAAAKAAQQPAATQPEQVAAAEAEGPVGDPLPEWGDKAVPITAQDVAMALMEFYKLAPAEARGLLTATTENTES